MVCNKTSKVFLSIKHFSLILKPVVAVLGRN